MYATGSKQPTTGRTNLIIISLANIETRNVFSVYWSRCGEILGNYAYACVCVCVGVVFIVGEERSIDRR